MQTLQLADEAAREAAFEEVLKAHTKCAAAGASWSWKEVPWRSCDLATA